MAEQFGYRHEEGLLSSGDHRSAIEGLEGLFAPEEIEQMRQSVAEVAADMEAGQQPFCLTPLADINIPPVFTPDEEREAQPIWGVEPLDEQIDPEEASLQSQREHARYYYLTLTALAHRRYRREETLPEAQELTEAYTAYQELTELENQNLAPSERLPNFTLTHLWAAAQRYNTWVTRWIQEQGAYETPEEFEEALFILLSMEHGLANAVRRLE